MGASKDTPPPRKIRLVDQVGPDIITYLVQIPRVTRRRCVSQDSSGCLEVNQAGGNKVVSILFQDWVQHTTYSLHPSLFAEGGALNSQTTDSQFVRDLYGEENLGSEDVTLVQHGESTVVVIKWAVK